MWLERIISTYITVCIVALQISFSKHIDQRSSQTTNFDFSTIKPIDQLEYLNGAEFHHKTQLFESPSAQTIIDKILVSNRQGRNLEGYDEVYADPEVKNALQFGNDTLARSYIRNKLCLLGLMNCAELEERHPFYSSHRDIHPQDVIYAQPVTIKPVGRPLPAIPVKKSVDVHSTETLDIESGKIYSGSFPPLLSSSYLNNPPFNDEVPTSFLRPHPGNKLPSTSHSFKPVYESGFQSGISYDDKFSEEKPDSTNVQQHVHHHYHHNEGSINAKPVIGSRPIVNNAFHNYGYGNGGNPLSDFEYKKNYKIQTSLENNVPDTSSISSSNNYANRYISYEKPIRDSDFSESHNEKGLKTTQQLNLGPYSSFRINNFGQNNYRPSNQFETNIGFSSSNHFITNNKFTQSNDRLLTTDFVDCVCVQYNRCATLDQAGRKDDNYLAIDPRNIGKNIEADTDQLMKPTSFFTEIM
ncbi:uncharacterized protein LOC131675613 [Phymastichus coffea]|uniref:uncharacterized protein LOC131675613 n=1 Tax=Phymastichus coffea TaxID=108790 RepID=UPI00273AC403|nr:uncharacterized protein LOC131675613 [Phymastichus coffea]